MNIRNRELSPQSLLPDAARSPAIACAFGLAVGAITVGAALYRQRHEDRLRIEDLSVANAQLVTTNTLLRNENEQMGLEMEDLQHAARTDSLTELSNHRHLEQLFETHVQEGTPFGIIIFDLENFKAVNDELGHGEGDRKLRIFARILQGTRDDDEPVYLGDAADNEAIALRTGGDEFALLLSFPTGSSANPVDRRSRAETLGYDTVMLDVSQRIINEYRNHPEVQAFNALRPYKPQLGARANFAMHQPGETLQSLTHRADVVKNGDALTPDERQKVNPSQMDIFELGA